MKVKVTVVATVDANTLADAETTVKALLGGCIVTEVTYVREVIEPTQLIRTSNITPMDFDAFSKKYVKERLKAGDTTDPESLTQAYAVYCANPDGHWLHKE